MAERSEAKSAKRSFASKYFNFYFWHEASLRSAFLAKLKKTINWKFFFAPLRGKWPQKWSPGQFALLGDWLVNDLQILLQKNEKRLVFSVDMSKCPKNVHLFWKMSINKNFKVIIYRAKNIKTQILTYTLYLTRLQMSPNDIQLHPRSSSIRLSLDRTFMIWNLFLKIAISKFLEKANFFLGVPQNFWSRIWIRH